MGMMGKSAEAFKSKQRITLKMEHVNFSTEDVDDIFVNKHASVRPK